MGTRVLSLWLPHVATDRIGREQGRRAVERNLPRAVCSGEDDDQPLTALCPRAERAGLDLGMSRSDALRRVPGLVIAPADPDGDERFLESCISWCEPFTPFVTVDRSFTAGQGASLWLDIGSSAHVSGGEVSLLAGVLGRFRRNGVVAKAAIADRPGSAWAACRFGGEERRILPANGARVALAPWPVDALRLDDADCERLRSAGFDRIEHLYALPRASLAARFGDQVALRLDQALGLVDEPIGADTPLPAQQAQMIFADPIVDMRALAPLIERLVHQLCIGLEAAGLGAKRLTLALYRVDNSTVTCSIGADRPLRDARRLAAGLAERCSAIDLGFGLERVILDAVEIEPMLSERIHWRGLGTAAEETVPDLARRRPRPPAERKPPADLEPWTIGAHQSPPPPMPPFLGRGRVATRPMPAGGGATAAALAPSPEVVEPPAVRETPPRPLRLLRQPEPIEAIASLPDEPPVLFRWRRQLHKVVSARGPEPVAPDWWLQPDAEDRPRSKRAGARSAKDRPSRDYFAVEDSEGARFWLFRDGRYGDGGDGLPRWFLHGVFA